MHRFLMFGFTLMLCLSSFAQTEPPQPTHPASNETTLSDQTDIAVTVYNNNRALVRDRRAIKLPTGEQTLTFMDVAAQIQPETVSLTSLTAPGKLVILEQNYEYDLMSPNKLMEKYVGREVTLVNQSNDINFTETKAKLLSVNEAPVYEVDGQIHLGYAGHVVLPEIPEELIAKPSLIWTLDNGVGDQEVEATYLTGGLSWQADYVVIMNTDDTEMDLEGWVTLSNQSGAAYKNAQLKLVAGEVNIVPQGGGGGNMNLYFDQIMPESKMASPREESFAEYHLYTLPRRTTIKQNQSKQVRLLGATGATVEKKYEYRGQVDFYSQPLPGPIDTEKVGVFILFQNKENNQLGMPLPGGVMRVYKQDSDGMLQFAGEDRIEHTPKDEQVRLRLGNAFDVTGERKQTDYKVIAQNTHESAFEIVIKNHKKEPVTVDIIEPMPADWKILEESIQHVKKDAQTAIFSVKVDPDGEAKVSYRVRVRY